MEKTEEEARKLGYDKRIFYLEDRDFIFNSITYEHFIRDDIDFVVVKRGKKFSLMRKSKDINTIHREHYLPI